MIPAITQIAQLAGHMPAMEYAKKVQWSNPDL